MEIARIDDETRRIWRENGGVAASPARDASHALVSELRAAARAALLLAAEETDLDALAELTTAASELAARIGACPRIEGSPATSTLPSSLLFERSPVTGHGNAVAPPLEIRYGRERTVGTVTYTEAYEGPPGGVHGGVVAAAFDEMLGIAQMASGAAGFTGTLAVRFHRVTPIHTPIEYEAWVDGREGRKLTVRARSTVGDGDEERLLAEASGVFVVQVTVSPDRGRN